MHKGLARVQLLDPKAERDAKLEMIENARQEGLRAFSFRPDLGSNDVRAPSAISRKKLDRLAIAKKAEELQPVLDESDMDPKSKPPPGQMPEFIARVADTVNDPDRHAGREHLPKGRKRRASTG
jgi:hypothetical protein